MTTIIELREIVDHVRDLPNKRMKTAYLNLQSREVLNFLAGHIQKDGIAKTIANEIPTSSITEDTMERVVMDFNSASGYSGRNDKIGIMQHLILSREDREFVLTSLYGSLKLGVTIPIPNPIFGEPIRPQLCGTDTDFDPKKYIIEQKFDGIRCVGMNVDDKIRLYTRNGKPLNVDVIEAELLDSIPHNCCVDGEIVSSDGQFQSLQRHGDEIEYRVFDMPFLNGSDIVGLALHERRHLLEEVLHETDRVRISPVLSLSNMADIDKWISNNDVEGVVAKSPDSFYTYGGRKDWIKIKHWLDISGWITGYTEGTGKREGILGAVEFLPDGFKNTTLVGTGFTDEMLIKTKGLLRDNKRVRITVKYQELTNDKRLRFPVFLRIDEVIE